MVSIMDRRDPPQQPDLSGVPWHVKAILTLGVPSAIALFLVWIFAMRVATTVEALPRIEGKVDASIEAIKNLTEAISKTATETHEHGARSEKLIEILCVQGATTREERRDCLNANNGK